MAQIAVIHGPNLNLFGTRETHIYGSVTLEQINERLHQAAGSANELRIVQSNHEGVIIDTIHDARLWAAGILINPGAFTHYAWAIHDALASFDGPKAEVHISNPNAREPWRHVSVEAPVVTGSVIGFGKHGYDLAVQAVAAALGS